MKLKFIIIGLFTAASALTACNSILDIKPTDQVSDPLLWSNQDMVLTYTGNFYAKLNSGFEKPHIGASIFTGNLLSALTDDGEVNGTTFATYWNGAFDSSNSPLNGMWGSDRWIYIRRANLFLANVDQVPGDQELNKRMKAEIRFLRAYYYYDLMQWFGPLPIISEAQDDVGESAFVAKASKEEFYRFLIDELAEAALYLPKSYSSSNWGRVTKGAALMLKGRVELYAQQWASAAKTAKEIMDLDVYSLPADYASVFSNKNKMNTEIILSVQANGIRTERYHSFDIMNQPPAFGGRGGTLPTQNLVDAYEMKATGLPITDPQSGYDPQAPYEGRDPRLAATVLYDGAQYRGRPMQLHDGGLDMVASGGMVPGWVTSTGYYLRKYTDEAFNIADATIGSSQNWILMRYAEVLLNYAEAQNEAAGPGQEVYKVINDVRKRAGMPGLKAGLSKDEMRAAIRQERRVELAFEDTRYWDVKRWRLATELFSTQKNPLKKMEIKLDVMTGKKTYTVRNLTKVRVFEEKHYNFPFPLTEINKPANKIEQNTGW